MLLGFPNCEQINLFFNALLSLSYFVVEMKNELKKSFFVGLLDLENKNTGHYELYLNFR